MLEGVDLGLPDGKRLARDDRELLHEKRLAHVDGLDDIVDHAAAVGDPALLAGLPGPLDGVCAVEGAGKRRMEVDDGHAGGLERAEEGERENEHPAGTDHEVGLLGQHEGGEVAVEAVTGRLAGRRVRLGDALVVRLERVHGGGDACVSGPREPVGRRRRGDDPGDGPVELFRGSRRGVDQRL